MTVPALAPVVQFGNGWHTVPASTFAHPKPPPRPSPLTSSKVCYRLRALHRARDQGLGGPQPSPKSPIALSVSTRVVPIQYSPQPRNETLVLICIFPAKGSSLSPCPALLGLSKLVLQRLHLHAAKRISGFRFGVQQLEGIWREVPSYAPSTENPHKFYRVKFFAGHCPQFSWGGSFLGTVESGRMPPIAGSWTYTLNLNRGLLGPKP